MLFRSGRIYWTEKNNAYQNFYGTFNARLSFSTRLVNVDLWARNLFDTEYDSFYFESMNKGFAQHGRPRQFGVNLTINL